MVSRLAPVWGVLGVCSLLMFAIFRLFEHVSALMTMPLTLIQWSTLIGFVIFMAYTEGYKGFQKAFAPRVVARAQYLNRSTNFLWKLFAPLFCMSYFAAPKKRIFVSFALTAVIIGFVVAMRFIAQPWRGIFDVGVIVGLSWGLASIVYFSWQGYRGKLDYPANVVD